jgi:hypothetical protein
MTPVTPYKVKPGGSRVSHASLTGRGLLKAHGVDTHRPVVSDEQAAQAVDLLQSGIALGKVAEQLGLAYTTLARALTSRGLPTRKTWA